MGRTKTAKAVKSVNSATTRRRGRPAEQVSELPKRPPADLGDNRKRLRTGLGLSLGELSARTGLAHLSLWKVENHRMSLTESLFGAIGRTLRAIHRAATRHRLCQPRARRSNEESSVTIRSSLTRAAICLLLLQGVSAAAAGAESPTPEQRLEIGHFHARAILACTPRAARDRTIAILIPGTGAHGPEEAMPGSITADGQETQILTSVARALRDAGLHTLQLGKPGIDFHTDWDLEKIAYDKSLYERLTWNDLLQNVDEAVEYITTQRPCGATRIVLLGHSEGTMRSADAAARNPRIRGLIFLGFHGRGYRDMVEWQAYRRPIELLVRTDIDADHDGYVTREEAARWPRDFSYPWQDGESRVSIEAYERSLRSNPELVNAVAAVARLPLYSNGFWERAPNYATVAQLPIPVLAFTGTLDVMTPPSEVEALKAACATAGKRDCEIHLVPGLGHGLSPPKPPRSHPLLDQTEGPVDAKFLVEFTRTVASWKQRIH